MIPNLPLPTVIDSQPTQALRLVLLLILGFLMVSCSAGPGAGNAISSDTVSSAQIRPNEENDLIRIGDSLDIALTGVPDTEGRNFAVKVDESGQISMPHIGGVPAAGLTTVQLKDKIETLYKIQKIYNTPNITIIAQQARFVSVTGEVRGPQRMFHSKDLTALGAIASCGGFTDYANRRKVRILRGNQLIEFNALDALSDPSRDVPLLPDDKIQVDRSIF
ncbi:MAG: hypothetical protein HC904_03520 [Blastochloris sp.]|nr:hypothetical protein [Blastochloris sp.]